MSARANHWQLILAGVLAPALCLPASTPANTDWELLGNSAGIQHHADLDQVNTTTVSRLGLAWSADMPTLDGLVGNPLVKDGVVFQSGSLDRVYAHDLRTGKLLWTFDPGLNFSKLTINGLWAGRYNRGLALYKDLAIVGTADCRLVAVDQKTGKKRWEAQACDATQMYGITGAPRVGAGMVFIGNSCMESGITRGHVDAFDAATGERRWRFYTVPGDPSQPVESDLYRMAAKSWGTDWYSKSKGCGSAWDAMAYDPELDLFIFGVGGPTPFNPTQRAKDAGDELFTNSIVAVHARTGEYAWHFKELPQDGWNYEASVGIMVATLPVGGADRRVVISVPKSGFLYVLDGNTGKFISGKNYVQVNWAKGLDRNGRPIFSPDARYWEKPGGAAVIVPSPMGSHGWEALAYSPADRLVYIPTEVMPTLVKDDPHAAVGGMSMDFYYGSSGDPKWKAYGEIVAWDPVVQKVRWRHRDAMPVNGGLLHTAGNLVFQGSADGHFSAFDARSGRKLWSQPAGGAIRGAPSTVMLDGEQYIVVPTGNGNSSATGSYVARYAATPRARSRPRLLAYKLDAHAPVPAWVEVPAVPKPAVPRFERALAQRGGALFEQNICVDCHGLGGESARGAAPDLRLLPPASAQLLADIVVRGALRANGMPNFENLTDDDAKAIYAFLINEAWDAYEAPSGAKVKTN